jgi:hypothetical protein
MHRSPILFYSQIRDAGEGVIELTYVVHNFSARSDLVFDHLNAPWGGTRVTSLPVHHVGSPEGALLTRESLFTGKLDGAVEIRKTGGWCIASQSESEDSPSLALVFGRDRHREAEAFRAKAGQEHCQYSASVYRDFRAHYPQLYDSQWKDWRTRPENSFRNYDVIEVIPRLRINPGKTIWYRAYLVVNRRSRAVELAKSLVDKVDYGLLAFDAATTPWTPVQLAGDRVAEPSAGGKPVFELLTRPVPGTMPLFLIESTQTNREAITTDPYLFVQKEPLNLGLPADHPHHGYYHQAQGYSLDKHNSRWKRLLGYGYVNKPAEGSYARVSTLLDPAMFPPPDTHHLDLWVRIAGQ